MSKDLRAVLTAIRPEIDAALALIAKKHGVQSLKLGKGSYDSQGSFSFKLPGLAEGGLSQEAQRYNSVRAFEGLPELGTTSTFAGHTDTIVGMNTTGTKVLTKRGEKQYWWKVEAVKSICAKKPSLKAVG